MDETKSVPKLRFASYSNEWTSYKLGDILTFYSTNSFSREKLNYDGGSVKNIHYGDIHTKYPTILSLRSNNEVPYINNDVDLSKFKKDQYLQNGDLIIADASEDYEDIGKAIEVKDIGDEKVLAGLHTILARDENKIVVNGFKAYLFSTNNLKTKIKVIANGISVLGISKNNLSKLTVNIPSEEEQQKIVSFISSIDKKIELLEQKHHFYLDFKKYLMQQIFAQKLRFDFDDEWKNIPFKRILKEINEKTTVNNQHEILSSTKEGIFTQKEYFADRNVASKDNTGYKILRKNQIVLSPQNLWMGNINVNTEFDIGIVSPSYKIYETTDLVDINYFKHVIKLPRLIYEYTCASEQGASIVRRNLNKQLFNEITIKVPSSDEQKKIGNLLDACDEKIKNIDKNIQDMKEFKKGLLQQMFDNMPLLFKFNIIINE